MTQTNDPQKKPFDFQTVNPWTGESIQSYSYTAPHQLESLLERSILAQLAWKRKPIATRSAMLYRLSNRLRDEQDHLAELLVIEMGKPISQAKGEVQKSASVIELLCEQAETWLVDEWIERHPEKKIITHQPLGVLLGVMPWNFPIWQSLRFAIPALLAGNTVLIKPAENTFGTALALDKILKDVTGDTGLYQTFCASHSQVEELIADERIKAVSLTGSTRAGKTIAAACGRALKKCVLELGGSDAFVILEDADLDLAARLGAQARLQNAGQSCVAAKRFIVVESIYSSFLEKFKTEWRKFQLDDPMKPTTTLGPLARHSLQIEALRQIRVAVDGGARQIEGSSIESCAFGPAGIQPTILEVEENNAILLEEIFAPIALVQSAVDTNSAIRLANSSPFGLGAALFTKNIELATKLAREDFEAGMCVVNDQTASEALLPFGGIKNSGYGKELGRAGMLEFVNSKSIRIKS